MTLYNKILSSNNYLATVKKIENIKFISNGKWDWEHGLGHFTRVAGYINKILVQLGADERTIDLGMVAALLHDIGLIEGHKINHAIESGRIFTTFINRGDITADEEKVLKQAIVDHSKGDNIKSLIRLALVLADKLDVTYHRTENSSIQDLMNKEIQKIRDVDIKISDDSLIVSYMTYEDFNIHILEGWPKAITVPYKVSNYLNKKYIFLINNKEIDISKFLH